jgi:hypothetical protein
LGAEHSRPLGWRSRDFARLSHQQSQPKEVIMLIYLLPIFAFGLVITGIVFLGLRQASELAQDLAAQSGKAEVGSKKP